VLVTATVVSVTAATLVSRPAFAGTPLIQNRSSLLCLQPVPLPGQYIGANGVRIAQMPCDSSVSAQVWEAEPAGHSSDGQYLYYIVNYYDPNNRECLDVTDANPNDKAPIQQWFCNGGGSEKWMKGSVSFGGEQYVNARTGKCLDVPYASYSPVYIWQYHCTSPNAAQAFNWPGTGL